jgi:hypothetical protein
VFLLGGALQVATVYWAVPRGIAAGLEPMVAWMVLSVPLIFVPVVACGMLLLRTESDRPSWPQRLRLQRPSALDWLWGAIGIAGIAMCRS